MSDQARNRFNVLRYVQSHGPISRTELTSALSLSSGTVTEITSEMLNRQLIRERKDDARRPGRPRLQLEVNPEGAIIVSAGIAADGLLNIRFVDLVGDVRFSWSEALGMTPSLEALSDTLVSGLGKAIAASGFPRASLCRIKLSLPAQIDCTRGIVQWMVNMPDCPFAVGPYVERHFGIAVTLENNSADMARAEYWFGRAKASPDFLMVNADIGLSAARMIDGIPFRGANGRNIEFSHVKVDLGEAARSCYCGSRGCLSAYSSMSGIVHHLGLSYTAFAPPLEDQRQIFREIMAKAAAGDRALREHFDIAGYFLGVMIGNYINISDPGKVFLFAIEAQYLELIEPSFREVLPQVVLPSILDFTQLELGVTDPKWRERGAAALALEQLYRPVQPGSSSIPVQP